MADEQFKQGRDFLDGFFEETGTALRYRYDAEQLIVEAWGENSLRVRATKLADMPADDWALLPPRETTVTIQIDSCEARITNGKLTARINQIGRLTFYNQTGAVLLDEYVRNRRDMYSDTASSLQIEGREFKPIINGDYQLTMRFVANADERIYGMGQYQQPFLNLKGADLELAQRNSQASVPFALSSKGYGFLWNNPAVGRVTFSKNTTVWEAVSTKKLDYWITAGDTPAQLVEAYADATGKVPMMPDYAMGFWQSKLRYQTQDELLTVARAYKRRNLPISVIVCDFFHWTAQGDWKFDPDYWPDPQAMVEELTELGIELMVSVWPTVDYDSENFREMLNRGLLIRTERGIRISMDFNGNTLHIDPTRPDTRTFVWNLLKKHYFDLGIKTFWLDEAEPEYTVYDFENYRYHIGPNAQIGNIYPMLFARMVYDGLVSEGVTNPISLLRCAWAGSQRYGSLVWSGDIHSSFASMKNQVVAGLNMGLAGIPWWTTDIGGFFGADIGDEQFHELFVRWFQYGTFCPVMRLHGNRWPFKEPMSKRGSGTCISGADNEVWSYGETVYAICRRYLFLREAMRPYITSLMEDAHRRGTPVMRPLFYDFPTDKSCWEVETAYLFGPAILVAPVLERGQTEQDVYLPVGAVWTNVWTGEPWAGGQTVTVKTPLAVIPIFTKDGFCLDTNGGECLQTAVDLQ
ncbi:glycoside hydrolase family 31 protein [uncultured Spirosoma sp.]|uniref:glycoside hydrolase family 31 protein n=1 Tax=uncultured Spirosoma sp. TaxID=278208 RepID=UPI0025865825|nr:glycoside hydrolase family 31 protein [uncultured Spirosoma sp.]